jgi:hypothetical protein
MTGRLQNGERISIICDLVGSKDHAQSASSVLPLAFRKTAQQDVARSEFIVLDIPWSKNRMVWLFRDAKIRPKARGGEKCRQFPTQPARANCFFIATGHRDNRAFWFGFLV